MRRVRLDRSDAGQRGAGVVDQRRWSALLPHGMPARCERGGGVRFPTFTGSEPCTELGPDLYSMEHYPSDVLSMLRAACGGCSMLAECAEWSVRHEGPHAGFWAGMTGTERVAERRRRNILLVDPMVVVHRASA